MPTAPYPAHIRERASARKTAVRKLGYQSYRDYLRSPAWRALRIEHRNTYGETCCLCEEKDKRTHLHHLTYERVGNEQLTDLARLCGNCHRMIHTLERRGEISLNFDGLADLKRAARYAIDNQIREARMTNLPDVKAEVAKRRRRPGRRERARQRI